MSTYSFDDVTILIGPVVNGVPVFAPLSGLAKVDIAFPNKKWSYTFGNKGHATAIKGVDSKYFEGTVSIKTGSLSKDYLSGLYNDETPLAFSAVDQNGTTLFVSSDCRINIDKFSFETGDTDTDFMVLGVTDAVNMGGNS
jgi:hypothetical protein